MTRQNLVYVDSENSHSLTENNCNLFLCRRLGTRLDLFVVGPPFLYSDCKDLPSSVIKIFPSNFESTNRESDLGKAGAQSIIIVRARRRV